MPKRQGNKVTPITAIPDQALVPVQRSWNGWRTAEARAVDLEDIHWFQPLGAPKDLLHAYISPSKLVSGSLSEVIDEATSPERLLVCVLKSHTCDIVWLALANRARRAS